MLCESSNCGRKKLIFRGPISAVETLEEPIVIFIRSVIKQFDAAVIFHDGSSDHVRIRIVMNVLPLAIRTNDLFHSISPRSSEAAFGVAQQDEVWQAFCLILSSLIIDQSCWLVR